eukprot:scaffold75718_cov15-Tisochrysis_lutea.AAC.1
MLIIAKTCGKSCSVSAESQGQGCGQVPGVPGVPARHTQPLCRFLNCQPACTCNCTSYDLQATLLLRWKFGVICCTCL